MSLSPTDAAHTTAINSILSAANSAHQSYLYFSPTTLKPSYTYTLTLAAKNFLGVSYTSTSASFSTGPLTNQYISTNLSDYAT